MGFYVENSLASSLHSNGHAEYHTKQQLSSNGVPAGANGKANTLAIFCPSSALCLQECQQQLPLKSLGTQTQERDQSYVIRSTGSDLLQSWPCILSDPRGVCGSLT